MENFRLGYWNQFQVICRNETFQATLGAYEAPEGENEALMRLQTLHDASSRELKYFKWNLFAESLKFMTTRSDMSEDNAKVLNESLMARVREQLAESDIARITYLVQSTKKSIEVLTAKFPEA